MSLADCREHGPSSGNELLLVEGESAASSVVAVRDERFQAVLPLQGKPMNAWTATQPKVAQHVLYQQLGAALGLAVPTAITAAELSALRYERVVLLFDGDADGIHIGALMVLYFHRWLPQLLAQQRVWLVRAPMFEVRVLSRSEGDATGVTAPQPESVVDDLLRRLESPRAKPPVEAPSPGGPPAAALGDVLARQQALNPHHCQQVSQHLRAQHPQHQVAVQAYRGLGSISPEALRSHCVHPGTRVAHVLRPEDVQAVVAVFGQGRTPG